MAPEYAIRTELIYMMEFSFILLSFIPDFILIISSSFRVIRLTWGWQSNRNISSNSSSFDN